MNTPPTVILLFVDGLGWGEPDPAVNPLAAGAAPVLARCMAEYGRPVDATLGVDGLPQSATGQTTLFTGLNAAVAMGRHVEGFPGPALKAMLREYSLFAQLLRRGFQPAFANAYFLDERSLRFLRRRPSVTSVMTLEALGEVRGREAMLRGEAVCQDLTRAGLVARGYDGPLVTPEESAAHLAGIAGTRDLTLFEYFQTDRAGHGGDPKRAVEVLGLYDRFLAALLPWAAGPGRLLLLCSDHGNIEDLRVTTHTRHPVPFVAIGAGAESVRGRVRSLLDVTPAILGLFG